jgi:hypothetical protein
MLVNFLVFIDQKTVFWEKMAKDTGIDTQAPLFQTPLIDFINSEHRLVKLANKIDWPLLETEAERHFCLIDGRPIKNPRLITRPSRIIFIKANGQS